MIKSNFFIGVNNGVGLSYSLNKVKKWIPKIIARGFNVGVHGILMSINKATGAEAGDLYTSAASATHPSGVTYSVVTTGAPTLINFDTLTDGWFEQYGNFNYQGFPADFSNELLVSETGVTTFGPKAAVSAALSLPTITVL